MTNAFFITKWIFLGMRWLLANVASGDVFVTVFISTLVIKLLTMVGDIKSRQSSVKMSAIQPEINKIQKKYANDPQKAQKKQQELMRERGVSMWSSCLPMLFTLPIFFFFIAAFRQLGNEEMARALYQTGTTGSTEIFESFKWLWVNNVWQADNGTMSVVLSGETFLATKNLDKLIYFAEHPEVAQWFTEMGFFVENVKSIPAETLAKYNELVQPMIDVYPGVNNGWFILPLLAAGSNLLSSWIMQKNQPAPDPNNPNAKSTKLMTYLFPAMSFIFCLTLNAAFAMYWTISGLFSLAVNLVLNGIFKRNAAAGDIIEVKPAEERK